MAHLSPSQSGDYTVTATAAAATIGSGIMGCWTNVGFSNRNSSRSYKSSTPDVYLVNGGSTLNGTGLTTTGDFSVAVRGGAAVSEWCERVSGSAKMVLLTTQMTATQIANKHAVNGPASFGLKHHFKRQIPPAAASRPKPPHLKAPAAH